MGLIDFLKSRYQQVRDMWKARVLASRDTRLKIAHDRRMRDKLNAIGSRATSAPKRCGKLRPRPHFISGATDSTPNRYTWQRLTDPKRRPRIKRLNKGTGRFEYLSQYQ